MTQSCAIVVWFLTWLKPFFCILAALGSSGGLITFGPNEKPANTACWHRKEDEEGEGWANVKWHIDSLRTSPNQHFIIFKPPVRSLWSVTFSCVSISLDRFTQILRLLVCRRLGFPLRLPLEDVSALKDLVSGCSGNNPSMLLGK